MGHKFAETGFTDTVKALQVEHGSRAEYAGLETRDDYNFELSGREAGFIAKRDSFYMASVSETGWPYVQHRGGPAGFMKVLDAGTIGFADYSGNRQYISAGNFRADGRVSLFFMDYPGRRRLKIFGRVVIVGPEQKDILAQLEDPAYPAQVERAFLIRVEGYDWNCPAHITPRFTEAEVAEMVSDLRREVSSLRGQLADGSDGITTDPAGETLGEGSLELVISGVRQLTPVVRAYELRHPDGAELPAVSAGSHLRVPMRLPGGELTERHYSIASDPARRDSYEIAVRREDAGSGASVALHASYRIGLRLQVDAPGNHFGLHDDTRPAVLLAAGIGITPLRAMSYALAQREVLFHLHHAGASLAQLAFRDELAHRLGARYSAYARADGERLDLEATMRAAPTDALFYACGPDRFIAGLFEAGRRAGIARGRIRVELFS